MSDDLRIAFVSGHSRWWRKQRLIAKYLKMRLEGLIYPDVYCLPLMLSGRFDFLLENEAVPPGKYDLIFAELQGSQNQLNYLESLVRAGDPPVAVIPGPPEILARDLTDKKLGSVKYTLGAAKHVWAYSPELKAFCDGLIGSARTVVIPWPYDLAAVRKLGKRSTAKNGQYKILLQSPLVFNGITQNHPFVLKSLLLDLWKELPVELRDKITFHTFVYSSEDRKTYHSSGFPDGLPFVLERKRGYAAFVRFLAECDGVVNLTAGSILGRITFLSAALGLPGIFSDNSELNRQLYPGSVAALLDTKRLRELLRAMMLGLATNTAATRLLPSNAAAVQAGDLPANRLLLRQILLDGTSFSPMKWPLFPDE